MTAVPVFNPEQKREALIMDYRGYDWKEEMEMRDEAKKFTRLVLAALLVAVAIITACHYWPVVSNLIGHDAGL